MSMKFPQNKSLLFTAAACAALTACGGGGSSSTSEPTAAPAAATFADCFVITPGVIYTTTGDLKEKIVGVKESFEGAERTGIAVAPVATGVRDAVAFWSPEADGIHFWGQVNYNNADHSASSKDVSQGNVLPLTMQVGQSVTLDYTETSTFFNDGTTSTQPLKATVTFEGFETVTFGGKTFDNACRIKTVDPTHPQDGVSTDWYAKGFGLIHSHQLDGAGNVAFDMALDTIIAQP